MDIDYPKSSHAKVATMLSWDVQGTSGPKHWQLYKPAISWSNSHLRWLKYTPNSLDSSPPDP